MCCKKIFHAVSDGFKCAAGAVFSVFASVVIHISGADKHDTWPSEEEMLAQREQWKRSNEG